jgi:hypothetical protein
MKRTLLCGLPLLIFLTATSCILDAPDDRFHRTLWKSDEVPLGPFPVHELTLEFLCGQTICIKTDVNDIECYGSYESNDHTAVFKGLTLSLTDHTITFIDADWSGETLFLRWRIEDSVYPFTTAMRRLPAYQ